MRYRSSVLICFLDEFWVFRTDLSCQVRDLRAISWVFKYDDVMRVERDVTLTFILMKEVLGDKNNAQVAMMGTFGEHVHHMSVRLSHEIIDDDQSRFSVFRYVVQHTFVELDAQ